MYNYNELDGTSTDYEWIDLPENSAFKEFNNFFDELGNPTNVPSMEEEPKHLRSSGIELDNCRNVTIKNCTLKLPQSKGGGGNGYLFNISAGNNDILIEDCEIRSGHGITLGSEMSGGIRNVTFRNIFYNPAASSLISICDCRRQT